MPPGGVDQALSARGPCLLVAGGLLVAVEDRGQFVGRQNVLDSREPLRGPLLDQVETAAAYRTENSLSWQQHPPPVQGAR